jgi:hypothetical protein
MAQIGQQQANLAGLQTEFTNVSTEIGVNQQKLAEWKATLAQSEIDIGNIQDAMSGMTGPAQEMLQAISDGSMSVADSLPQVLGMLRQIEDPIEQNRIGVALFGTQWEDMTAQAMLAINTTSTGMDDMTGSMALMNEQGKTTAQEQAAAMNQIMLALKPLGDAFNELIASELTPLIQEYAPQVAEWLGTNVPVAVSSLQSAIEFLTPVIDLMIAGFNIAVTTVELVISVVDTVIGVFVNLSATVQGVITPVEAASNVLGDMAAPIRNLISLFGQLVSSIGNVASKLTGLKPPKWLSEIGGKTKSKVKGILGFADGGTYPANEPFIVGERGPEVVVPNGASGTVIPNDKIGDGGKTINAPITIHINGSVDDATIQAMEKRIHATLDRLIQGGAF